MEAARCIPKSGLSNRDSLAKPLAKKLVANRATLAIFNARCPIVFVTVLNVHVA